MKILTEFIKKDGCRLLVFLDDIVSCEEINSLTCEKYVEITTKQSALLGKSYLVETDYNELCNILANKIVDENGMK